MYYLLEQVTYELIPIAKQQGLTFVLALMEELLVSLPLFVEQPSGPASSFKERGSPSRGLRTPRMLTTACFSSPGKENKGNFNRTVTTGGFFIPATKMHTGSAGSSCDLSKESEWGQEGMPAGAEGGCEVGGQIRPLPEQLKVFRPIGDPESEQSAPKLLGMFYTSNDSPGKSVFTSSLFQMEPSPRHQRKALNISEPFAVSVPLRVSAVISTNSTPCRTPPKELQSLSSLEEFSFQGSESGGWPEEEKPPGAESFPGKIGTRRVSLCCKTEHQV